MDRARRLAGAALPGRVMVLNDAQRLTGRRIKYARAFVTLIDQWTAPFVGSEVAGFGAPPRPAAGLFGRGDVVAALSRVIDNTARRRADAVVLVGEPGSGKTALLDEAERLARFRTLAIARASCLRSAVPAPLDGLRQLVRSLTLDLHERLSDDDLGAPPPPPKATANASASANAGAASALDDPSTALVLAGGGDEGAVGRRSWARTLLQLGLGPGDLRRLRILLGERQAEPGLSPARRRALLRGAVSALFRATAEQIGLCVLVDDLHAIDGPSYHVLAAVLAQVSHARAGLVATARTELSERALPRVARKPLPPLPHDVTAEVAQAAAFGSPVPQRVVHLLNERCGGNPLKMWLALRTLIGAGILERHNVHAGFVLRPESDKLLAQLHQQMPSTIAELVHALAAQLSPAARTLLRLAAQIGELAPQRGFAPAFASEAALATAAMEVKRVELSGGSPDGDGLVFRQPSVREALAALPVEKGAPQTQRSPAAIVAEALGHAPKSPLRNDQLAYFAAHGDSKEQAAKWDAASAAYHAACGDADVAAAAYQRALVARYRALGKGGGSDEAAVAEVYALAASAMECMAELDPVAAADFMLPLLKELPRASAGGALGVARAKALRQRAQLLVQLGHLPDAERVLDEASALCSAGDDAEEAAQIGAAQAAVLEARGKGPQALARHHEALRLVEGKKLVDTGFRWTQWLSIARLGGGRDALVSAKAAAVEARSARGVAEADSALARLAVAAGDAAAAQECLDDAAASWLAFGDRAAAARCLHGASKIAVHAMPADDAVERLQRGVELAQASDWAEGAAAMRQMLAALEAA